VIISGGAQAVKDFFQKGGVPGCSGQRRLPEKLSPLTVVAPLH
jgi:hypothetical protein